MILAVTSAVLMFFSGLIGGILMMEREEPARAGEDWAGLFDAIFLHGAMATLRALRDNWRARKQAHHLILWSFGFLGVFLAFISLHVWMEVAAI